MTDVIDDSLSWEQRRELRRKKRQELLAEADRLVQNTDRSSAATRTNDRSGDDEDSFEQERQKRRREREEKRKKEREELEKQLKEEEEARAERERRREERRRQREEGDSIVTKHTTPKESYSYTSTSITTTRVHNDSGGEEDIIERTEVTEITEVTNDDQDDFSNQNGEDTMVQNGHEDEDVVEENIEVGYDDGDKMYKSSVTTITIETKSREVHESSSASSSDAEDDKDIDRESRGSGSSSESEEDSKPVVEEPSTKSRSELLEERRRQRELKQQEEAEAKKAEAEKRKAEHEAKIQAEKEARERRMAEGEAKRKEFRKQSSQDPLPLSAKGNAAAPLVVKSGQTTTHNEDDVTTKKTLNTKPPLKSKPGHLTKTMESVGKHSYPSRSQSVHVRSGTAPGTPSRPISRKNQTRRSLNAMEKQAGELYDFLSELEDVKSAGPRQLKEFLENSERSEKSADSVRGCKAKPVTNVRDRLKQFSSDTVEAKRPACATHSASKSKPTGNVSKTPRPPARSDSMKRLELARSKHALGSKMVHRPVPPNNISSTDITSKTVHESPSATSLSKLEEEEVTQIVIPVSPKNISSIDITSKTVHKSSSATSLSKLEEEEDVQIDTSEHKLENKCSVDTGKSVSSENTETMHLSEYDNNSAMQSGLENKKTGSSLAQLSEVKQNDEVSPLSQRAPKDNLDRELVTKTDKTTEVPVANESRLCEIKVVSVVTSERLGHMSNAKQQTEPEERLSEHVKQESSRVRSRNRGRKPALAPKPYGTDSSEAGAVRPARKIEEQHLLASKSAQPKITTTFNMDRIFDASDDASESRKTESTVITSNVEDVRAKRRERRRNNRKIGNGEKTCPSAEVESVENSSMKHLSEKMADSPKTSKPVDTNVAKLSSLDDRLKNYTSKAQKQDQVKKGVIAPKSGGKDVANRLNMWESGRVATVEKTPKKVLDTAVVKQGTGVSTRKNMWESGKVASSPAGGKKSARAEIHGADFSSRKNMWLKATQVSAKPSPGKPDGQVSIKTGVMSRLSKWEKGEVTGSGTPSKDIKKAADLPVSDVVNRRNKWENIAHDSPAQTKAKTPINRAVITTDVSNRKNLYESKASSAPKAVEAKPISTGRIQRETKQVVESEEEEEEVEQEPPRRKESLSSSSSEEEKYGRELSDSASEDEQEYGRRATSGSDDSDQE